MVSHKTSPFYNFPVQSKDKKPVGSMDINATFADLPAPELKWEEMAEAPVVRLDGAAIQIKNLLYVFAGYGTINLSCGASRTGAGRAARGNNRGPQAWAELGVCPCIPWHTQDLEGNTSKDI